MNHSPASLTSLVRTAVEKRKELSQALIQEGTDAYRLFHGVTEGREGLSIDRYGPLILVQTFREALSEEEFREIGQALKELLPHEFHLAYRGRGPAAKVDLWNASLEARGEFQFQEFGVKYWIRAYHPGQDPWLFLDLRAGRRYLHQACRGQRVLNLFSYTCGAGVSAATGGAREVWNVDFSGSSLEIGRRNAELNGISESVFHTIEEECQPVMRQWAGLPAGGRFAQNKKLKKRERQEFDFVFLDPPAWSKGAFGAVDVVGDYPGLFKPALLCTRVGGKILATHHVPSVKLDDWLGILRRCATKAGREIRSIEVLKPEADFPSFDGNPPLKIAVCDV